METRRIAEQYKDDWCAGFSSAINLDACISDMADISVEAYCSGYGYAMDWIIKENYLRARKVYPKLMAAKLNVFCLQTLFPVEIPIPKFEDKNYCYRSMRGIEQIYF